MGEEIRWTAYSSNVGRTDATFATAKEAWEDYISRCDEDMPTCEAPGMVRGDCHETFSDGSIEYQGVRDGHGNVYLDGHVHPNQ